jgi:predicted MFS family arabinose efflux permease
MAASARTAWGAVLLAFGAGIVAAFQVGKAPIALPFIRTELGLDLSSAAWILSILALLGATAGASMGSIVTRLGARHMLPVGLGLLAIASLAGSQAPSLALLLASRAVEGVGFMIVAISAPALITLVTQPRDRQMAFGLWGAFMPFGVAIAMMAAPALPLAGWRGLWMGMAALLALYGLLVMRAMPHPPGPKQSPSSHILRDILATVRAPGPILLALAFVPYSMGYISVTGFLPTLLIERMGVSPGTAGLMAAAVAGVNILGNLSSGPLLRLGVPRWAAMAASLCITAACAWFIFSPGQSSSVVYILCLVFSATGGVLPACALGGASVHAPDPRLVPVTLGLLMQGSNIGQLLGPVSVGKAVAALGWPGARLVLVPAMILGIGLTLALKRLSHEK